MHPYFSFCYFLFRTLFFILIYVFCCHFIVHLQRYIRRWKLKKWPPESTCGISFSFFFSRLYKFPYVIYLFSRMTTTKTREIASKITFSSRSFHPCRHLPLTRSPFSLPNFTHFVLIGLTPFLRETVTGEPNPFLCPYFSWRSSFHRVSTLSYAYF